jgi:signal transduction histidine kinase/CheY-like chemotaxis protein
MKLHFKIGLVLFAVFTVASIWIFAGDYESSKQQARDDIRREADNIRGLLMATRRVYHHQFVESGIPLNDDTIGFLPAHALARISDDFENWSNSGLIFNNVSERPRNPANQADAVEMEAIRFFQENPESEERFTPHETDAGDEYYHYARPIWMEEYCLKCHGEQSSAPKAIQDNYETAFDCEVGELRGILSIKLPSNLVTNRATAAAGRNLWSHVGTLAISFLLVYWLVIKYAVRNLRKLEATAQDVANGDYEHSTGIVGNDEIALVAATFDTMVERLADRDKKMSESLKQEKLTSERLEAAVDELDIAKQSAEEATRSKSEFLANMSHEIRTPMTAILGFSEIVLNNLSDSQNIEGLETIQRNGRHLLEVINDILDVSKIELGKLQVEWTECSPSEVLGDVVSLMRVRADAKGLVLEIQYDTPIPETILSDPTRLRQILINLVGNAVKFTETGTVRLAARVVDADSDSPRMQFDVIDSGIGMTEDQISKLFQPFVQADASTTRKFGGTGLGLTISKRLAELLGGGIQAQSTSGKGSTFSVTVSANAADRVAQADKLDAPHASSEQGADSSHTSLLRGCRILLAEDGPDNQRLISFILKQVGAEVTIAENGQIALDLALEARDERNPYDVILMDMQMPVLGGYEATTKLREAGYSFPVVALTAHAMATDRQECLDAGCDDYATKPIDRERLVQLVAKHARRELQHDEVRG